MNQEPILKYDPGKGDRLLLPNSKLHHIVLFAVGIVIAVISNLIAGNTYTASEISYAEFTLNSDAFISSSIIGAFLTILRQNTVELAAVCLVGAICITVFSRSLISLLLILKGFAFCRYIGVLICLCNRSTVIKHQILLTVISFLAAVIFNIVFIYLCTQAREFGEYIIQNKKNNDISILFSPQTIKFLQVHLTVLGTVVIISLLKSFLLWLVSLI